MTRGQRKTALAVGLALAGAPGAVAAQTGITIYNDGRVLVRRELGVAVPKGASTQKLALGALDPASLFPLDSGVAVTRLTYDGATDEGSALRRSVGRRVVFRLPESKDTLSALVLGVDPLRLQLPDGRVTFQAPGRGALSRRRRGGRADRERRSMEPRRPSRSSGWDTSPAEPPGRRAIR